MLTSTAGTEAPQIWVEIRIGNRFGSLFLEAPQIWIYPFYKM
jgi:hypothetical protein